MTSLVYSAGTVSVSNGSASVIGTGSAWATALVTGGMFSCAGLAVPILSVNSDTSLTLAYPWPGASGSGLAYAIARETSEAVRAVWTNDRLATLIAKGVLAVVPADGSGTLAERDALDPVPAVGFWWVHAEPGYHLAYYRKSPSGWDGPYDLKGDDGEPGPPGAPGPAGADGDITWYGAWTSGVNVTANQAMTHGGSSYVAKIDHLSAAANEPGVGAGWAAVWDVMAAKGIKGDKGDKGDPGQDGTGTGDVVGPASSVDGSIALYNGTTGKLLKGGAAIGTGPGAVPVLDGSGLLDESVLPALAITDTFEVADQAAMLALTAQRGDIAVRSDLNKSFILKSTPAATLANWIELRTPTDAVLSVAALTGAISAVALKAALSIGTMAERDVTISTADPSGGTDGQVWLKYTP